VNERGPAAQPWRRTALVHDFLLDVRGAERVFEELCALFPDAELFATVYDEQGTEGRFSHRTVHTSFLQRLHPRARTFRALLPLYPYAAETLDLRGFDLVISSSSAWAHGVLVDPGATHICYCHNPFRYAWDPSQAALDDHGRVAREVLAYIFSRWRRWDRDAARRVTRYVANSKTTQRTIARCFERDADVVYPPVELARFAPATVGSHYLVLSELMRHKRIAVAIEAFTRLRWPLLVVGDGPDLRRLRKLAGPSVQFIGRVPDQRAAELLASARALVVTAAEEFGIAAVEAQAAGRPVVALRSGGLRETVIEGVTGTFFEAPDSAALMSALTDFDPMSIDPASCIASAARFDPRSFRDGIRRIVTEWTANGRASDPETGALRSSWLPGRLVPSVGRRS
jgi:glycosyltransferase involved in cell wall biosynthesis